ncbi:hypothetical protein GCM10022247_64960 [Allokutzneria multivorans]|uniref:Uncharacterized protein n=1 Tax=Allokutzneria multivorans TaxID=1142134 RepID=A0ABP7TSZ4_9PSEU
MNHFFGRAPDVFGEKLGGKQVAEGEREQTAKKGDSVYVGAEFVSDDRGSKDLHRTAKPSPSRHEPTRRTIVYIGQSTEDTKKPGDPPERITRFHSPKWS